MSSNLTVEGKLVAKLDALSGESQNGPWVRREFILELPSSGSYVNKLCVDLWGERTSLIDQFQEGEDLVVSSGIQREVVHPRAGLANPACHARRNALPRNAAGIRTAGLPTAGVCAPRLPSATDASAWLHAPSPIRSAAQLPPASSPATNAAITRPNTC